MTLIMIIQHLTKYIREKRNDYIIQKQFNKGHLNFNLVMKKSVTIYNKRKRTRYFED